MLSTDYMEEFHCVGPECEDTCCAGWTVTIDKSTYKKYQKINDPELKNIFKVGLVRVNNEKRSDAYFAAIRLDEHSTCPLVAPSGLCRIHSKFGEKTLSQTCRSYPRIINIIGNGSEASAKLSCPEVARLALMRPDGIEFRETTNDYNSISVAKHLKPNDPNTNALSSFFWPLQLHAIETLKDRASPLWQRVLMLGLVYSTLEENETKLSDQLIQETISNYHSQARNPQFVSMLNDIPYSPDIILSMLGEFVAQRAGAGTLNKRFRECHDMAITYLTGGPNEPFNREVIVDRFEKAYYLYYKSYMDENTYLLENYLVNYTFQSLFPALPEKSVFSNYLTLVIHYATIRIYLIALAGAKREKFDHTDVLKLIQSFTKVVEHNEAFMASIRQHFLKLGYNLGHLSLLVKDPEFHPKTNENTEASGKLLASRL